MAAVFAGWRVAHGPHAVHGPRATTAPGRAGLLQSGPGMPTDSPHNPLYQPYPSPEMPRIFSSGHRFRTWRRLWITLAESERELGLPITAEQIDALQKTAGDADLDRGAGIGGGPR